MKRKVTADDLLRAQESQKLKYDSEDSDDISSEDEAHLHASDRFHLPAKSSKPDGRTNAKKAQSFTGLGVSSQLQTSMSLLAITTPTDVQVACIPPLLAGRDCIGNAKTGSGKTVAFAIPILQKLSVDPFGLFALVLTPTRELAFQISEQFSVLGSTLNIRTSVIVGGMDMIDQALELNSRPHVIVATPGRLVDHLNSSNAEWDLSRIRFLVLDEADRLLTPTFAPELARLFDVLPADRQTCLFTATMTPAIDRMLEASPRPGKQKPFMHRMPIDSVETVSQLKQYFTLVPSHIRESYLFHLLCKPPQSTLHLRRAPPDPTKPSHKRNSRSHKTKATTDNNPVEQPPPTIIFCRKPRTCAYLGYLLKTLDIRCTALHSRLTQRERLTSLQLFKSSVIPVLISTDVGSRGLDIEDVAMVVNWDLPNEPEEYTHRVGRTARAGKGGVAVSFVTEHEGDDDRILKIETRIKTELEEMDFPEAEIMEQLNQVSTAKRLAKMELHDSDFGAREDIRTKKRLAS